MRLMHAPLLAGAILWLSMPATAQPADLATLETYIMSQVDNEDRVRAHADYFDPDRTDYAHCEEIDESSFKQHVTAEEIRELGKLVDAERASDATAPLILSSRWMFVGVSPFDLAAIHKDGEQADLIRSLIEKIVPLASAATEDEWSAVVAAREAYGQGTCDTYADLAEAYFEAHYRFRVASSPYADWMKLERIPHARAAHTALDSADMRSWRPEHFAVIPDAAISRAMLSIVGAQTRIETSWKSADWAQTHGSKNRFLMVVHPETSSSMMQGIVDTLSAIDAPFLVVAGDPKEFDAMTPEAAVAYVFENPVGGVLTAGEMTKLDGLFRRIATMWQDTVWKD